MSLCEPLLKSKNGRRWHVSGGVVLPMRQVRQRPLSQGLTHSQHSHHARRGRWATRLFFLTRGGVGFVTTDKRFQVFTQQPAVSRRDEIADMGTQVADEVLLAPRPVCAHGAKKPRLGVDALEVDVSVVMLFLLVGLSAELAAEVLRGFGTILV